MTPPVARIEVVRDTYFGVTVDDPYRWMEDWESDEARAWLDAQAAHARAFLDALPQRAALRTRIGELSAGSPTLDDFKVAGGRAFYLRRDPGADLPALMTRGMPDGPERVLLDPNSTSDAARMAIDWYVPSPDGQRVAYGVSEGGSENSTLHALEVESGRTLDVAISRVRFAFVSWLEDNRSFVYHRYPDPPADTPPVERRYDTRTYLHRLGGDPEQDPVVFARGLNPRVEMTRLDRPFIVLPPHSAWMIGIISHSALGSGKLSDCTLYTAPRAGLSDPAACPWTRVAEAADGITNFAVRGDTLYLVTSRAAPRYQALAVSLRDPLSQPTVVVPEGPAVIEDIRVAGGYLLTRDLDGGIGRLRRIALAGGAAEDVALPMDGTILGWANEPDGPEVLLHLTSWTEAPRVYRYDVRSGAMEDTRWIPPSPSDFGDVEAYETQAPAADGTLIPLSIIHKKGLPRDGNNPTLLTGYGSYGIAITPFFRPEMLAWYERGGVWAIAHLRGGGEFGREWHEAGRKLNKETTIGDFIACAEYLIAHQYTRPERLAGEGGSAGGIPSGGALVRRPDLWAAMVMLVAVTNALRLELSENGPVNVPEFGSVATEEGFQSLRIIDSYARVRDGAPYPAALLTTGLNDPRVPVWQATKMAARLQAATTSGRPVLVRVEEQGGHGPGATREQADAELADELAFVLHACGA
jgi:prolyl oligopeptidase